MSTYNSNLQIKSLRVSASGDIGEYELAGSEIVRAVVEGANSGNTLVFKGRIAGQTSYTTITTLTGNFNNIFVVDTYDYLKIECSVLDAPSTGFLLSAAGFATQVKMSDVVDALIQDTTTTTTTTWSSSKITDAINEIGDRNVRTTRFESIGSGTSGTLTIPVEQQIILDDFGGTVDAIVSSISSGRPSGKNATNTDGEIVTCTLDALGNYTLLDTPSSYPVAIVYRVRQKLSTFEDTDSNIIGELQFDDLLQYSYVTLVIGDGSNPVATSTAGNSAPIQFNGTIMEYSIATVDNLGNQASVQVEFYKDPAPSFPPSTKISGTAPVELDDEYTNVVDLTSSDWSRSITSGDCLRFNVLSTNGVSKKIMITLKILRKD